MKKKIIHYLIPVVLLLVTSAIYFSPVLEGKILQQSDIIHHTGMSKEIVDFRKDTGEEALWTNSMFGGMPAYQISTLYQGSITRKVIGFILKIPRPISYHFLLFSLFYLMFVLLGVNPWLSFAGALAYGFTTFFFVILEAGHNSKALNITYISLLVAGILLAYRNKRWVGFFISLLAISWMISANHLQITYYAVILTAIIVVVYFIYAIKDKEISTFFINSAVLFAAAILALLINIAPLWTTYEYGTYTIRGKSELTKDASKESSGLDKDYILDYSYDVGEALTAFVPRLKGGSMRESLGEDSNVYKTLSGSQGKQNALRIANSLPLYWGSQPIAGGYMYFGAVLCFLFVFGLFITKGKDKWWIIAAVVISFLLSLGKYFPALSNLMIDYFPLYNKFRDVKNIIVLQQFAMAFMGVMAVSALYKNELSNKVLKKGLLYSFAITGGLALLFALVPGIAGDFTALSDARLTQAGWPEQLLEALRADRKMVLQKDAFRSFVFVALAAGVIWAYITKKLNPKVALVIWILLIFVDMWPANKRYLNNDSFVAQRTMANPYTISNADKAIHQDKDLDYRVLNLTVNPFTDASTSYFHKSLGGYHGAKLKRYQELIEHHISPEIQILGSRLNQGVNPDQVSEMFNQAPVIKMLNTKYLIINPNGAPIQDPNALGNAWFVNNFEIVENADEEIAALEGINPGSKAIVDKRFSEFVEGKTFTKDANGMIELIEYQPNNLKYKTKTATEQLAVFSEIYYDKGWDAYIDGEKVPHFRVDYILRALTIPAGEHTVEFKFEPKSYYVGNKISMASSILLLLAIAGFAFSEFRKRKKKEIV
jgi:MFS family permease